MNKNNNLDERVQEKNPFKAPRELIESTPKVSSKEINLKDLISYSLVGAAVGISAGASAFEIMHSLKEYHLSCPFSYLSLEVNVFMGGCLGYAVGGLYAYLKKEK